MNLSTMEKNDLLNDCRDAAARVHAARVAWIAAGKTEEKRLVLKATRHDYHDTLDKFLKAIAEGLDISEKYDEYREYETTPWCSEPECCPQVAEETPDASTLPGSETATGAGTLTAKTDSEILQDMYDADKASEATTVTAPAEDKDPE